MSTTNIDLDPEDDGRTERMADFRERIRKSFVMIPMAVLAGRKQDEMTWRDVCIYLYLLSMQGAKDHHWWSIESMAAATGVSETDVKVSIARLKKCGHIRRKKTKKTTLTYCLSVVKQKGMVLVKGQSIAASVVPEPAIRKPSPPQPEIPSPIPSADDSLTALLGFDPPNDGWADKPSPFQSAEIPASDPFPDDPNSAGTETPFGPDPFEGAGQFGGNESTGLHETDHLDMEAMEEVI